MTCDMSSHEAIMRTFERIKQQRAKHAISRDKDWRLPAAQAAVVIGGLSLLAWGLVIAVEIAVRAIV